MLNQVLVKCKINEIKKYLGKQIKGTLNSKEMVVYIRLLCDEFDVMDGLDLMSKYDNILLLEYIGNDFSPIYMNLTRETVGDNCIIHINETREITEKYISGVVDMTPSGVVPMVKLPQNFKDLELLYKLNQTYPQVHFCGGDLFVIKGCNIGCCNIDLLQKKNVSYDVDAFYRKGACNCALEVHDFKDIKGITNIQEEQKDTIEQQKEVKKVEKQVQFADLLGGSLF